MSAPGISFAARGLARRFDRGLVTALSGLDLEIAPGERLAITGPTGCGKSTLLSILALLDRPDDGELEIDGHPARSISSPEDWRAANVGIIFQFHHLLAHLTTLENVRVPLAGRCGRREAGERARAAVSRLGLDSRSATLAANLSGGERQLTALARALVVAPRLILADEPTGNVDSATGERIVDALLTSSYRDGSTLVVVTHDPRLAGRLDRVVAMRDGKTAPPEEDHER